MSGSPAWSPGTSFAIRSSEERRKSASQNRYSVGASLGLLSLAFFGLWIVPAIYALTGFPAALDRPLIPAIAILGVVALCGALLLFYRSHADLGRNWSISLEIRNEHRLVTTGIYRFVRHPMYSSFFLLAVAQLMLLPNWFAGATGLIGVGMLYAFRIRQEERMMTERFGAEYRDYVAHTARLIPWLV